MTSKTKSSRGVQREAVPAGGFRIWSSELEAPYPRGLVASSVAVLYKPTPRAALILPGPFSDDASTTRSTGVQN